MVLKLVGCHIDRTNKMWKCLIYVFMSYFNFRYYVFMYIMILSVDKPRSLSMVKDRRISLFKKKHLQR